MCLLIRTSLLNSTELDPVQAASSGLPGRLVISGNYTQTASANLTIDVRGLTPETEFDQVTVDGVATLAGTLTVSFSGGF